MVPRVTTATPTRSAPVWYVEYCAMRSNCVNQLTRSRVEDLGDEIDISNLGATLEAERLELLGLINYVRSLLTAINRQPAT